MARLGDPIRFHKVAIVNAALLWFIILSGGLVRLTASGLGCPDWPLCNGGVVPETSWHSIIEYSNRAASAAIIVFTVITWLASRKVPDPVPGLRGHALAAMLMSFGQIPLGGVTVLSGLHPLMVGAHFLLSVGALTSGVLLVIAAHDRIHGVRRGTDPRQGPFAAISAVALLAVVVTGVLVTAAGPHSGDDDVLKRFGNLENAAWLHVRAVGVLVVLMGVLAVWIWKEAPRDPFAKRAIAVFLPVLAVQITLGEIQYRQGLPWQVIAAHLAVAGLVWSWGIAAAWRIARPPVLAAGDGPGAPSDTRETVGASSAA